MAHTRDLVVTVDTKPFIQKAIKEVNAAIEGHLKVILQEAFSAGFEVAAEIGGDCCGCSIYQEEGDFEGWFATFIEQLKAGEIECEADK